MLQLLAGGLRVRVQVAARGAPIGRRARLNMVAVRVPPLTRAEELGPPVLAPPAPVGH